MAAPTSSRLLVAVRPAGGMWRYVFTCSGTAFSDFGLWLVDLCML
jgi:hypothetical protein